MQGDVFPCVCENESLFCSLNALEISRKLCVVRSDTVSRKTCFCFPEDLSIVDCGSSGQICGKSQEILFRSGGDQSQLNSKSIYLQPDPKYQSLY